MKIGVSSYSFAQYIRAGKMDYFSAIEKAKEMGFDGIEFSGLPEEYKEYDDRIAFAVKLREHAEKTGIEISAYLTSGNFNQPDEEALNKEIARLKAEIDVAKTLGVSLMRHDIAYAIPKGIPFNAFVDTIAPAIREVTEYAEGFGIKTMFENHGRVVQDADRVEKIIEAVGSRNFGLLIDIGNFMCADLDNVACVGRLANLAFHGHLKDFRTYEYGTNYSLKSTFKTRCQNNLKGCAVGDGDARSAQCMSILKDQGYDGYLTLEYEGPEDCIEGIQKGLDFYRKWEAQNV